jgi:hypothetical protein
VRGSERPCTRSRKVAAALARDGAWVLALGIGIQVALVRVCLEGEDSEGAVCEGGGLCLGV